MTGRQPTDDVEQPHGPESDFEGGQEGSREGTGETEHIEDEGEPLGANFA